MSVSPVKVLSVRQPWAWAIAMGHKNVENRSWTTLYRGDLVIHSSARVDEDADSALASIVATMRKLGLSYPRMLAEDLPYSDNGRLLAVVDLLDVCSAALTNGSCDCGPWAQPRQAHWLLGNVRRIAEPIVAKGRLGLWNTNLIDAVPR